MNVVWYGRLGLLWMTTFMSLLNIMRNELTTYGEVDKIEQL